mmetsp:Transcript_14445/g.27795  ORF Transcript_14445/g.27795 Transcript_14445/m.27795 type:complete len:376 (+) Transcript_14445:144-1271(+)
MARFAWYAVRKGRNPGVYRTYAEVQKQVSGFSGAMHKGFHSESQAQAYVRGEVDISAGTTRRDHSYAQKSDSVRELCLREAPVPVSREDCLVLFTDGGCSQNSNVNANTPAGWGVVVLKGDAQELVRGGEGGARVVTELFGPVVTCPAHPFFVGAEVGSNNTAEMTAVVEALLYIIHEDSGSKPVYICHDSMLARHLCLKEKVARKNVALATKMQTLYAELTLRCGPEKVRFVHVKGHSGHKWNDVADRLAERGKSGARNATLPYRLAPNSSSGWQHNQNHGQRPARAGYQPVFPAQPMGLTSDTSNKKRPAERDSGEACHAIKHRRVSAENPRISSSSKSHTSHKSTHAGAVDEDDDEYKCDAEEEAIILGLPF